MRQRGGDVLSLPAPMAKQPKAPRPRPSLPERRPPRSASRRKRERRREQQRLQATPTSRLNRRLLAGGAGTAVVLVVLLVVLLSRGHTSTTTTAATPTPGTPAPSPVPTALASLATAASGSPVDGIQCQSGETAANQHSAHVSIYADGSPRSVPAGVGVGPPRQSAATDAGPFVTGACYYALLTHTPDGIVHVEPPSAATTPAATTPAATTPAATTPAATTPAATTYTLGQFFDIWGQPLSSTQVGPASGAVTVFVNGTQFSGDPRTVPLSSHAVIQIDVGTVVPFVPYTFPAGD